MRKALLFALDAGAAASYSPDLSTIVGRDRQTALERMAHAKVWSALGETAAAAIPADLVVVTLSAVCVPMFGAIIGERHLSTAYMGKRTQLFVGEAFARQAVIVLPVAGASIRTLATIGGAPSSTRVERRQHTAFGAIGLAELRSVRRIDTGLAETALAALPGLAFAAFTAAPVGPAFPPLALLGAYTCPLLTPLPCGAAGLSTWSLGGRADAAVVAIANICRGRGFAAAAA